MQKDNITKNAGELIGYFAGTIESEMFWRQPHEFGAHWIGRRHYRQRLEKAAEWSAQNYDGDFVEIGAFHGKTTVVLAKIAKKYNRRVIVIDPWSSANEDFDGSLDYIQGDEYDIWCNTTKEYSDIIDVYRVSSHDASLPDILDDRVLSFAWVDGSHTAKALENDLNLVKHCQGVIGVDDISYWLWCDACRQKYNLLSAFNSFVNENSFMRIKFDWLSEGYIFCGYKSGDKSGESASNFLGDNWQKISQFIQQFSSIAVATFDDKQKKFAWFPCIIFQTDVGPVLALSDDIPEKHSQRWGPPTAACSGILED